jgi:hypothetical protein
MCTELKILEKKSTEVPFQSTLVLSNGLTAIMIENPDNPNECKVILENGLTIALNIVPIQA